MEPRYRCKACGMPIVWKKTAKGGLMPCDPERIPIDIHSSGDLIVLTEDGHVTHASRWKDADQYGYISHYATCPFGDRFRRRKEK